eukprot:g11024.t1
MLGVSGSRVPHRKKNHHKENEAQTEAWMANEGWGDEELRFIDPVAQNSSDLEELFSLLELRNAKPKAKLLKYISELRKSLANTTAAAPAAAAAAEAQGLASPAAAAPRLATNTMPGVGFTSQRMLSPSQSVFARGRQELNLARILQLSMESKKAVEVSGDCNAIILLGATEAGKTTTTNFLGGRTMRLYTPPGTTHKRVHCENPFEGSEIAFGAASVTRNVKAFPAISTHGHVWLVDPPGILDSAGAEVDIANAVGTQYAFRLVKSARPVLLINIHELTVTRARNMVQVVRVLNDWFHPIQDYYPAHLTIFFTHLDENKDVAVRNVLHVLKEVVSTLNYHELQISDQEAADLKYLMDTLLEVCERVKEDCILFPHPPTEPAHYLDLLLKKQPIPREKLLRTIPISQENNTALSNQCGNLLFESEDHLDNDDFKALEQKLDVLQGLMEGTGLPVLEGKYTEISGKVEAAFDSQLKSLRSSLASENYEVAKQLLALKDMDCLSKHVTGDRRRAFENAKKELEDHMLELGEAAKDSKQPVATMAGSLDRMQQVHHHLYGFLRKGVAEDYYNSLRGLMERLQIQFDTAMRVIGTLEEQKFAMAEESLTSEPFPSGFKGPEAMAELTAKPALPEGQTIDVLEAALADLKQLAAMETHGTAKVQHPTTGVSFAEAMRWYERCVARLCKLLAACAARVKDKGLAVRLEKEPAARLVQDVFTLWQVYQNANMALHVDSQILELNLALHQLGEIGSQQLAEWRKRLFGVDSQPSRTAQTSSETSDDSDADIKGFQVQEFTGLGGSLRAVAAICCCKFEEVQTVRSECSELLVEIDLAVRRVAQQAQQRWDAVAHPAYCSRQDQDFLATCLSQLMSADKELRAFRLPPGASTDPPLHAELAANYTQLAKQLRKRCRQDIQEVVRDVLNAMASVNYLRASTLLSRLLLRQSTFNLVPYMKAVMAGFWKAWGEQMDRLQSVWENKMEEEKAVMAYLRKDAVACPQEQGEAPPEEQADIILTPHAGELDAEEAGSPAPQQEASKQEKDRQAILLRVRRETDAKAAVVPQPTVSHSEALFYLYLTHRQYHTIVQGPLSQLSEHVTAEMPVGKLRLQLGRALECLALHIKELIGRAEQQLSAKLEGREFADVKNGMEELDSLLVFERYEPELAASAKQAKQNLQLQLEKKLEQLFNSAVKYLSVPNYPGCESTIAQLDCATQLDKAFGRGGLAHQLTKLKTDHAARKNNLDQHMNEYLNSMQFDKILAIVKPFKEAADQSIFLKYNAVICTYLRDKINLDKLSPKKFFYSRQENENEDDKLLYEAFKILTMCQSAMVLNDVLEGFQLTTELANIAKRIDERFRVREAKLVKFMGVFEYTKAAQVMVQLERFKQFDDVWQELWPQPRDCYPLAAVSTAPSLQGQALRPGDIERNAKKGSKKKKMNKSLKSGSSEGKGQLASLSEQRPAELKAAAAAASHTAAVTDQKHQRPTELTAATASVRHFEDWLVNIESKHFRHLKDKTLALIQNALGPTLVEVKRQGEPGESPAAAVASVKCVNWSSDLSFVDTILKNSKKLIEEHIDLTLEIELPVAELIEMQTSVEELLRTEWQNCEAAVRKAVGDSDIATATRQMAVARSLMSCKFVSSLHSKLFKELEDDVTALINQPVKFTMMNVDQVCDKLRRRRYESFKAYDEFQKSIESELGSQANTVKTFINGTTWANSAQLKIANAIALFEAYIQRLQEVQETEMSKRLVEQVRELSQELHEKGSEDLAKLRQKYEQLSKTLAQQEDSLKEAAKFIDGVDFLRAIVDAKRFWRCLDTIKNEAGVLRVRSSQLSYAKCEEELQQRLQQAVDEAHQGLKIGRNTKLGARQATAATDGPVEEKKIAVYSALQILLRNLEDLFTPSHLAMTSAARHQAIAQAAKKARNHVVQPIREKLQKSGQQALQLCKSKKFKELEPIWEDLRQLETAIKEFSALIGDMPVDGLIKLLTADIDQQFEAFYAQQSNGLSELAYFIISVIKSTREISQKEVQAHTDEQVRNCFKRYHNKVNFFELAEILSQDEVGEELVSSGSYPEFVAATIKKVNDLIAKSGITSEDALRKFKDKNPDVDDKTWERLKAAHEKYDGTYQELVKKYLKDSKNEVKLDQFEWKVHQLAEKAASNDIDFPILLAHMNALWTVASSAGAWHLKQDEAMIKSPNVIQAQTLLRLIGADQPPESLLASWGQKFLGFISGAWSSKVASHLAEVETGGGKSIVLGLLATFLALLGCQVDVACYSKRLIERDEADFDEFWKLVGVRDQIKYWTLNELSSHVLTAGGDVRELTKAFLTGQERQLEGKAPPTRPRILLIDEVDVFMQKDFYGKCYEQGTLIKSPNISKLFKHVWNSRQAPPTLDDMKRTQVYQDVVRSMPRLEPVLGLAVASMLRDVQHFNSPQYQLIPDCGGRVVLGYRDHGDISTTKQYGFKKSFAYLYEAEKKNGRVKAQTAEEHLGLIIPCGSFSYAAVPKTSFACILGVTGTLSTMEDFEKEMLKSEFKINLSTLTPSIYPNNKFKFDEQRDVVCLPDRAEFFQMLALDAIKRRQATQPVLIFFHSDKALEDFVDSEYGKRIPEIRTLREDEHNFPHALRCTMKPGQVTCLPAILGRGIDFKCNSKEVEAAGGVHVIQAFFSMDLSEERQIKGRTARQMASGSYQLILCVEDLKALELTAEQIQAAGNSLYQTLSLARHAYVQRLAEKRKLQVQRAERMDFDSRAYQSELRKPARFRDKGKLYSFLRTAHSATARREQAGSFHWIFAIDISSSMSDPLATKNNKFRRDRLGAVCEQAWDFLMGRPGPDQYYSLVVFDHCAEILFKGQNARPDMEQTFLGLKTRGATDFEEPFRKVIELMEAPEIKQLAPSVDGTKILFLSDGAAKVPGAIVENLMRTYPGIRIWTVKFGDDGGDQAKQALQEIARRGKGECRESLNGGELGEVLEAFAAEPMEVY